MRLLELEPQFIRYEVREGHEYLVKVDSISEAQGIKFRCPKCWKGKDTHHVICWNPSIPPDVGPKPGRWTLVGTGIEDLTLVAGSSSIQLLGGCCWHGFIEKGEVRDA